MEYRDDEQYHGLYLTEDEIRALPTPVFNAETRKEYLALRAKARQRQYPPGYLGWLENVVMLHPVEDEPQATNDTETKRRLTRLERAVGDLFRSQKQSVEGTNGRNPKLSRSASPHEIQSEAGSEWLSF